MTTTTAERASTFSLAEPPPGATRAPMFELVDDLWWAEIREWDYGAGRPCQLCRGACQPCDCLMPPETAAMCWRAGDPIYPYPTSASEQSTKE